MGIVSGDPFAPQLERILQRDVADVVRQQRRRMNEQRGSRGESYVLFGAGSLGRAAVAGLRKAGIEPVAFADNNPDLWNKEVDGVKVLSPQDAADRFRLEAFFVVTVYTSQPVWDQLQALGIAPVSFAELAWAYSSTLLPHACLDLPNAIFAHPHDVREGLKVWADDQSRNEYIAQLGWHTSLDRSVLPPHLRQEDIYFPSDIIERSSEEVFVDCGAFDGDTVQEFMRRCGTSFARIVAIEPDPTNFAALKERIGSMPEGLRGRIALIRSAVGASKEVVRFNPTASAASAVGSGSSEVASAPLDDLLVNEAPSYIKMDIEGAERGAIQGARRLLSNNAPVLAICLYHRLEHLWEIPLLIRSYNQGYNLFLRRYADECWELVCYAVPTDRLKG